MKKDTAWKTLDLFGDVEYHATISGVAVEVYTAKASYRCKKKYLCRVFGGRTRDFEADSLDEAASKARAIIRRQAE